MKKNSLLFLSIALGLAFAGCQSKVDDSLTTDSFKSKAILQGNVYYSLGQDFVDSKYIVDKRMKAKGKTIYLDVLSSEYKPGAVGVVTYTAVIDTAGNYKFTIPVKTQGTTAATIRMEQFLEKRQVYDKINAGKPEFKSEEFVFAYTKNVSLFNGSLQVSNFSYNFTPVDIPDTYKEYITFNGSLSLAYEKGFRDGALKNATDKTVEVTVNYPQLGSKHFGATVDQNGNYSVQIPVVSRKDAITASVMPVGYVASDYVHYPSSGNQVTLSGIYKTATATSVSTGTGLSDVIPYNVKPITLFFEPFETTSTYITNLAGWIQQDPTIFKYPVTLTGNVLAAYEKSYLVGDYAPITGKTVFATINMGTTYESITCVLATDNTGKYTLPIKLPLKNMGISITVNVETYGISNYTHYFADGTSSQLNGWYQSNYFDIAGKAVSINEFTSTYTLDNLYRVFTPVDNSVKEWYSNLFGWYQISGKKSSITITGAVKKAVEGAPDTTKPTAWAVSKWTNATNQPFIVTIAGKPLLGITGATGQYNLTYPLNTVLDPTLSNSLPIGVVASVSKLTNFTHYTDINATASSIQGSYYGSLASATCLIENGICTVKDCYMFFTPTTLPTGWSYYNWPIN